jgi:hypothetical protein
VSYRCGEDSFSRAFSNRLSATTVGGEGQRCGRVAEDEPDLFAEPYHHDAHGNMDAMPHLTLMRWDYRDQLQATSTQLVTNGGTPETTYYVYDASGQRVRKVTDGYAAPGREPERSKERVYLGGFEIYREFAAAAAVSLERETLHIMDGERRIAMIEMLTKGNDGSPPRVIRFQHTNHLSSAHLEIDERLLVIAYGVPSLWQCVVPCGHRSDRSQRQPLPLHRDGAGPGDIAGLPHGEVLRAVA